MTGPSSGLMGHAFSSSRCSSSPQIARLRRPRLACFHYRHIANAPRLSVEILALWQNGVGQEHVFERVLGLCPRFAQTLFASSTRSGVARPLLIG